MKRLAIFLRSVVPADATQLLFLIGILCLYVAPRLRWWPAGLATSGVRDSGWLGQRAQDAGVFLLLLVTFAGIAGYFLSIRPVNRPATRALLMVCLPATIGYGLMLSRLIYLTAPYRSILDTGYTVAQTAT